MRSSEKRHRLLFERNLAGVYRNTIDGQILECNDALAKMLGFESRDDFKNYRAGDLYFAPVVLGWSKGNLHYATYLGVYAPTGEWHTRELAPTGKNY